MKTSYKIGIVAIGILLIVSLLIVILGIEQEQPSSVTSFEECVEAGYLIRELHPEECETPDGRIFTKDRDEDDFIICTLDAKECPDGSFVGRIPPNCEFETCPEE